MVIFVSSYKTLQEERPGQCEEGFQRTVREAQPSQHGPQGERCRFPAGKKDAWGSVTPEMFPGGG